jgi:hypothetical protein
MANYECDNCKKQFDSSKRKEYVCTKCGGSICAVCVKEVGSEFGIAVKKYCPVCNNLLSVDA